MSVRDKKKRKKRKRKNHRTVLSLRCYSYLTINAMDKTIKQIFTILSQEQLTDKIKLSRWWRTDYSITTRQ